MFPNPAEELMSLEYFSSVTSFNSEYKIFDVGGRLIKTGHLFTWEGHNYDLISTLNLESGPYFLQLRVETVIVNLKFIKL